jgi:hypothetical protein
MVSMITDIRISIRNKYPQADSQCAKAIIKHAEMAADEPKKTDASILLPYLRGNRCCRPEPLLHRVVPHHPSLLHGDSPAREDYKVGDAANLKAH